MTKPAEIFGQFNLLFFIKTVSYAAWQLLGPINIDFWRYKIVQSYLTVLWLYGQNSSKLEMNFHTWIFSVLYETNIQCIYSFHFWNMITKKTWFPDRSVVTFSVLILLLCFLLFPLEVCQLCLCKEPASALLIQSFYDFFLFPKFAISFAIYFFQIYLCCFAILFPISWDGCLAH